MKDKCFTNNQETVEALKRDGGPTILKYAKNLDRSNDILCLIHKFFYSDIKFQIVYGLPYTIFTTENPLLLTIYCNNIWQILRIPEIS